MSKNALPTELFGEHPSMVELRQLIARVARSKAQTVLIYGETGTGKGLVARMIHRLSARAEAPFIDINCAAIPSALLESELFGHEKGSFTGAVGRKQGLLEAAEGGTFFLDEVRELDPVMQAKILTLLDTRRIRRVGGVHPVEVNVRFIAATNKILLGEVKAGHFRDDLYYRLQVIAINIPPLRDRGDDILMLADRFLRHYNALHGSRVRFLEDEVQRILRAHLWPGNVRELENLIERICLLEDGEWVKVEHLPKRILRETSEIVATGAASAGAPSFATSVAASKDFHLATRDFQRTLIEQALGARQGSLTLAAADLGLTRHALRHHMTKLDIGRHGVA